MATPVKLNVTTSIVDFLKSQNKPSDRTSRTALYETAGLKDRLGTYVGSAAQNIALLKHAQTPTQTGVVDQPKAPVITPSATQAVDVAAKPPVIPSIGSTGLTAEQASASIPTMPSADEILQNVFKSSGFQNFKQSQELDKTLATGEAEAQKAALETKTAADTKQFVDSIGKRGLFFSGETMTGLNALAESLATSKLGVDRKLAGDLLRSDFETRDQIIKQVADVVKQAQDGRKEAISSLEKVGLTVIGNEVVPTLAARNAEVSRANTESDNIRAEQAQILAIQREERQQENMNRLQVNADRSFALAAAASDRASASAARGTEADRQNRAVANFASAFVPGATMNGIGVLGDDGYINPNVWKAAIKDAPAEGLTRPDFVKQFGYLLNPINTDYGLTPAEMKLVKGEL